MKKSLFIVSFFLTLNSFSQVGINIANPNAMLEIKSSNEVTPANNDGLLVPKVNAFSITNPTANQQGMLVYLTTTSGLKQPGFYSWDNPTTSWIGIGGKSSWSTFGNSITPTNFIGTTNDNDLIFKRNSIQSGKINDYNTSFGLYSLDSNILDISNVDPNFWTGVSNASFGDYTLSSNTSGTYNAAMGSGSLYSNTIGTQNTAMGAYSLYYNTTGSTNTATGTTALFSNTIGIDNTANGVAALYTNVSGSQNTVNGFGALFDNVSGDNNSALGWKSLLHTTGGNNTGIGYQAGRNLTTGNNNIAIGYNAQVPTASASNQVRIGDSNISYAGIQVAWTITSDKRWKTNIRESDLGLDFIKKLNPVSYTRINEESPKTEYGFIAQELEIALNNSKSVNNGIISKDENGMYGVRYNDLISISIKAIQEQQAEIELYKQKLKLLEDRLNVLENLLKK